jgi:glycosyltransferase involved in cell wall biosynthesis
MLTIARNLDRTRFEMDIYCVIGGGELLEEIEGMGYSVRIIPAYVSGSISRYRPIEMLRLARELRQGRYDLVHTHLFQADAIGRTAALVAGVPKLVKSLHNMGAWKKWHHLFVDGCLASRTDRVICCSEALRESAIRQENIDPSRVLTIYHGVDEARFRPAVDRVSYFRQVGLDPSRRLVGTVGRPIAEKGHEHLLDAVPTILAEHPDVQFLIVGEGPLRRAHVQRVERESLSHLVRFAGARPDIPELLSLMDVFVFPSVREGFGIAVLEAMAAGVPVVASDIRPISEIVAHGRTGLLVKAANPPELASTINRLLGDEGLQRRLRANALDHVKANFTESQMVKSIESVYLDLCGVPRTPGDVEHRSTSPA